MFFAGADGTPTNPGHVGLVIGHGQMIEAYATGFPIRIASYKPKPAHTSSVVTRMVVGQTRLEAVG